MRCSRLPSVVGRIGGRPIFDVGRERAGQLERLVVRLGRERDDQVEVEPLPVLELLEGHGPVLADVDADLVHGGDRERIELALAHAGRAHVERVPSSCASSAAAIGERTELRPQANSTACGRAAGPVAALTPSSAARR